MKKTIHVLLAASLLHTLLTTTTIIAAQKTPDMGAYDSDVFRCNEFDTNKPCVRGEVTAVDSQTGRLTVKAKRKDMNLEVDSKAKAAFKKVKVGDVVDVNYTEHGGKLIATSIAEVKSKGNSEKK